MTYITKQLYTEDELRSAPDDRTRLVMEEIERRGRQDRTALFLHGLTRKELVRYATLISEPDQETGSDPAPDIFRTSVPDIQEWMYATWLDEEASCDDPLVPVLPFRDWLVFMSEDSFYRCHLHARFYLGETEPKLPI